MKDKMHEAQSELHDNVVKTTQTEDDNDKEDNDKMAAS